MPVDATPLAPYWQRLGIERPRLEPLVARADIKLFHLLVIALVAHGEPAPLELLADRLTKAGATRATGDLVTSLKKAWHGLPPIVREPDGRLALDDLSSHELMWILLVYGLRPPRHAPPPPPPPPPPEAADDEPLQAEELEAGFRDGYLFSLSPLRQAAAVLDACDRPMSVAEMEAFLANLTPHRPSLTQDTTRFWGRSDLVTVRADGAVELNRHSSALIPMRRAIRKLSRRVMVQSWNDQHLQERFREIDAENKRRSDEEAREAAGLRHVILHLAPDKGAPLAAITIDVDTRAIASWHGPALVDLGVHLSDYDVVAALDPRLALHRLGLESARWRVADLRPPQKTTRLNRAGRTLTLTPELIISSTTGLSRPLGERARIASYLASGDTARLFRRLESDAKALFALYAYGRLHGYVRLRWGFLDDILGVAWPTAADVLLRQLLTEAGRAGKTVEIVTGNAPEWTEPWARARRVRVRALGMWDVVVLAGGMEEVIPLREIQAFRTVDDTTGSRPPASRTSVWPPMPGAGWRVH